MTGIVILNVVLALAVVVGIVGFLGLAIISSGGRPVRRRVRTGAANRRRAGVTVDRTLLRNK